jgi:hypothetical protein
MRNGQLVAVGFRSGLFCRDVITMARRAIRIPPCYSNPLKQGRKP